MWITVFFVLFFSFLSVDVLWLIELWITGKIWTDLCNSFLTGTKAIVLLPRSTSRHVFWIEWSEVSVLFSGFGVVILRRPLTLNPNWVRRLSFSQSGGRTHKSRRPLFVTPPSPQLVAEAHRDPTLSFYGTNVSINSTEWPPSRQATSAIDGCDVLSLSARCAVSLCVGRGGWVGGRGTSF